MPKKYLLLSLFFSLGILLSIPYLVHAADFSQSYQEYLKNYDIYRSDNSTFQINKSQYLSFNTLNSKEQAITATKNLLLSRNKVLISYFNMLLSVNTDSGIGSYWTEQASFLTDLNQKIPAISSIEDSLSISSMIENKHVEYQTFAKKTSGAYSIKLVENEINEYNLLLEKASNFLSEIKNKQKDTTILERWLLDSKNKKWIAEQKIDLAKTSLNNLNGSDIDSLNEKYITIQYSIFEAHQYLKEGLKFLNEFSENIKYGNY